MTEFVVMIETAVSVPSAIPALLTAAAIQTLQQQSVAPPAELTILLTDDAAIESLNHQFRSEAQSTDVLSFPAGEPMPGMPLYLGDIAISWPFASRQAAEAGHSAEEEAQLLTVHGVLHLLGHDHATQEEKKAMWASQTAVMQQLGIAHVTPTETDYDQ